MSEKILPIADGEVLQECIKTYGASAQIDLAIEEMSELIKALLKERRAVSKNDTEAYNLALVNVAEEMSDVIIMLTQLTLIFKNQEKVEKFINFKLKREKLRLEEFEKIDKIVSAIFETADDYEWEENEDGSVTITGYTGNGGDVVIPSEINGKPVTSIGGWAFDGCTELTSVTIPDNVTSIGVFAFDGCTGLTSVIIPGSVTSIGRNAFYGCTGLTDVTIPDSVTSISSLAFYNCTGLTNITIPASVIEIGSVVFYGCDNITIHGYKNSYAETYANENGIDFELSREKHCEVSKYDRS